MSQGEQPIEIQSIPLREVAEALRQTRPFAETDVSGLSGVEWVDRVKAKAGSVLAEPGQPLRFYWLVLDGEIRAERLEPDGSRTLAGIASAGEGFGEAPLLTGKTHSPFLIVAARDSLLVRFTEQDFWALLACCPAVRTVVLANMAQRLQVYQVEALPSALHRSSAETCCACKSSACASATSPRPMPSLSVCAVCSSTR
jgi:CRP-like cAMP-binding protein